METELNYGLDKNQLIEMIKLGAIFYNKKKFLKFYQEKVWCCWESSIEESGYPIWGYSGNGSLQEFLVEVITGRAVLADPRTCPQFDCYDYLEHLRMGCIFKDIQKSTPTWYKLHKGKVYFKVDSDSDEDSFPRIDDDPPHPSLLWKEYHPGITGLMGHFELGWMRLEVFFPPPFNERLISKA